MKVYIQTDIEGVAGFVFFENRKDASLENHAHRMRMRRLLTGEVNAAVRASFDAGADEVLVNDSHGSGYSIIFEDLDPRCEIIHGRNCSGPHWLPELDDSVSALVLVGMHAMGGTEGAILPHSKWVVNGGELYLSEATMACAIAGCHGIPAVFISGDQHIVGEARGKIPAIGAAVVKKALGAYVARSVIPAKARELIHAGVKEALGRKDTIAPFGVKGPIRLNLLEGEGHRPPFKLILEKDAEGADIEEAFLTALRLLPWCKLDVNLPDGFEYP